MSICRNRPPSRSVSGCCWTSSYKFVSVESHKVYICMSLEKKLLKAPQRSSICWTYIFSCLVHSSISDCVHRPFLFVPFFISAWLLPTFLAIRMSMEETFSWFLFLRFFVLSWLRRRSRHLASCAARFRRDKILTRLPCVFPPIERIPLPIQVCQRRAESRDAKRQRKKEGAACRLPPSWIMSVRIPWNILFHCVYRQTERQRQSASPSPPLSLLTRASPGLSCQPPCLFSMH